MSYVDHLAAELARVGVRGRTRARILAEASDHLAQGEEAEFGDPRELAQLFADEYATQATTRAAYLALGALALAGAGFTAGWFALAQGGTRDITDAWFLPAGLVAAFALILCPQVSFVAGVLALIRAHRLSRLRAAPAAELAQLARRTSCALAFGAATMAAFSVFALDYGQGTGAAVTFAVLTLPLAAAAVENRRAAAVHSSVAGEAGVMFPHRPWLACFALIGAIAVAMLLTIGKGEGPRNAVGEAILVVGSFAMLGPRLALRRPT